MTSLLLRPLMLAITLSPALALAQPATPVPASDLELRLERCAVLGDASARLACYDGLSKTAPAVLAAGNAAVGAPDAGQNNAVPAAIQPAPLPAEPNKVTALTTIPPE